MLKIKIIIIMGVTIIALQINIYTCTDTIFIFDIFMTPNFTGNLIFYPPLPLFFTDAPFHNKRQAPDRRIVVLF